MVARNEQIFHETAVSGIVQTAVAVSHSIVMRGSEGGQKVAPTTANTDYPIGIAKTLQTTVGGAVALTSFIPGQQAKVIDDGTLVAIGDLVMPSALVAGRAAKATPAAGEVVCAIVAETPPGAGKLCLVDVLAPFRYAAT